MFHIDIKRNQSHFYSNNTKPFTISRKDMQFVVADFTVPITADAGSLMHKEPNTIHLLHSSLDLFKQCNLLSLKMILLDPFTSIDDMYARMICLDRYFLFHKDYMLHFNNIYLQMTRLVREKIIEGTYFELPDWMKYYTVRFGNFYREALLNSIIGKIHNVPHSWRLTFKHTHKGDLTMYMNFALGMTAHIVGDLGIAISELDPAGVNATAKKSDSRKINGIIHNCSSALETALIDFYAPIINMTEWKTLFSLVLNALTDGLRNIAWKDGMFIAIHQATKESLKQMMDTRAWLLEEILVAVSPLFEVLRQYERSFAFEHYCDIVPWGCADNNN